MRNINRRKTDELNSRFTADERYAWQWLHDTQTVGFSLDLLKKSVTYVDDRDNWHEFDSLVTFAKSLGMKLTAIKGEGTVGR